MLLRPAATTLCVVALLGAVPVRSATAADIGPSLPVALAVGVPTALVLAAERPDQPYGGSSTLTGRLTDPATGAGVVGAQVRLEARGADGSWVELAGLTSDGSGAVSAVQTPASTTVYRLRHGDPGTPEESTSEEVTVSVHPALTAALDRVAVRVGRPVAVSGVLAPAGTAARLELQRRSEGSWARVGQATTGPDGAYRFLLTPGAPGDWSLRVARVERPARAGSTVDLPALEVYRLHRYTVRTRGTVRADVPAFRAAVAATYADPRGWTRGYHRFRAVDAGAAADFTVVLSQARYLPSYSRVCSTTYSCRVGRNVIINLDRWRRGSPYFPGTLAQYRAMVLNHETGHWLGQGHATCPGPGRAAPVMQQQSKGLTGCRVNPWPLPREIEAAS